MSSEEVAELEQAIHSHADVLYESWTKGSTRPADVMRRMEDTLELLADPGLTPKLEHLVSSFVKRDKEKRLQHNQAGNILPHKSGNSDKGHTVRDRSPSPGLEQGNAFMPAVNRKPLPKSILAVVQRFEPVAPEVIPPGPARSPSPSLTTHIPGIGQVSKNLLRSDSSLRHNISEQKYGFLQPSQLRGNPTSGTCSHHNHIGITTFQSPNNLDFTNVNAQAQSLRPVRERHIPIERDDIKDGRTSEILLRSSAQPMSISRGRANGNLTNNLNLLHGPDPVRNKVIENKVQGIQALEREEERLVRALRTGQVIPSDKDSPGSLDLLREKAEGAFPRNTNNHPGIDFAKERIRHSQEHPLTQQRLELQKRLPAPSNNLAAAIAVRQGKDKFQPPDGETQISNGVSADLHPPYPYHERESTLNGGTGRQSWVSTMLRFGPGSSVADRVQQFEKYPAHMVAPPSQPPSSPHPNNLHSQSSSSQYHPHSVSPPAYTPREITHTIRKTNTHHNSPLILSERSLYNNSHNKVESLFHGPKSEASESERDPAHAPWRPQNHFQSQKPDVLSSTKFKQRSPLSPRTPTFDFSSKDLNVPRFYWPEGKQPPTPYLQESIAKAEIEFNKFAIPLSYEDFGKYLQAIGVALYWKKPFWTALGKIKGDKLRVDEFKTFYAQLISQCPDDASRFMSILSTASKKLTIESQNNNSTPSAELIRAKPCECFSKDLKQIELVMADFVPMIQDIVDTHPGLGFLRDAPEFHSRYVTTVIARIYYKVNRSWTGRITLSELRRSNLLGVIKRLEEETDVNTITEYFSYEHFYVIYCKFWELDKDHDLLIDKSDLTVHSESALSSRIIDRIFSGTVIRGWDIASPIKCISGKMTYSDFVWFLISEEDKKSPTAIEYWFRCLDLDGDGVLSPYEIQHFYSEQESRIECLGIEPLDFSNVYCQMIDMLRCCPKGVRLKDLKKNPQLAANFFNTLFNLDKYLDHEQRDPFAAAGTTGVAEFASVGESDWDKYAAAEYELLIAEETPSDHLHDGSDFDEGTGISP